MSLATGLIDAQVYDAAAMRRAPAPLLQLALMDARNRTLGWLSAFDGLQFQTAFDGFDPPWWLAGQAGWFQEFWVARHVQRGRLAGGRSGLLPRRTASGSNSRECGSKARARTRRRTKPAAREGWGWGAAGAGKSTGVERWNDVGGNG